MRPRRLEVTAFGPFAGTETVDFDVLADAGLFLVSGPTGAGKTSLLDAMCYALYGDVPGPRSRDRLRSDHAPPALNTEVTLEFSLAEDDWRVTRKPQFERAKRRGTGTTVQKPTATLSRRHGRGWAPVCSGVEEVAKTIAETLGLDAKQFTQVVLLPQGEVQRALRADAREREQLLSALFHTGRFSDVAERLADRARTLAAQVSRAVERLEHVRTEAALRWREIAKELHDLDDLDDLEEPPGDQETLDALVRQAAAAESLVRIEAEAARAGAEAARQSLRDGELRAGRWLQRRRAEALLTRLDAEADELARVRARLREAEAAAPCRPLLHAVDAARVACQDAVTASDRVLARLRESATAVDNLDPVLVDEVGRWGDQRPAIEQVEEARRRLGATLVRLEEATARHDALERSRSQAAQHHRAAAEAAEAAAEADRRATALESAAGALAQSLEEARDAARRLAADQTEAARLRRIANAAAEAVVLQERWEAARAAALAAGEAAQAAEAEHLDLLRGRIEGMAGELAADLRPGEPCPVCGAEDHPEPAIRTDLIDPGDIEGARDAAEVLRREAEEAAAARDTALNELEVVRVQAGDEGGDPVQAAAHADEAAREAERTAAAAALVDRHAACAEDLERQLREARDGGSCLRERAAVEQARAAAFDRQAADEEALLAAVLGDASDPRQFSRDLHDVQAGFDAAASEVRAAAEAERDRDGCERKAAALAVEQGFDDTAAAAAAMLDDRERDGLRRRVEDHAEGRALAEGILADPEIAGLQGTQEPDVAVLEEAVAAAARAAESAMERQATVARAAGELRRLAAEHANRDQSLEPVRARADRLRHLADACRGTGNALRMSLERYVLAAYLEDITERASLRLTAMTDGRYTLRHSDERARGNAASGLSILVRDAFTGVEREVGSLSGGETFQASLALALGIADAVQSHSGGLRLDALFVDEGFGALDPEALEQALAELDRLREGGRMVGVISHVAALQERIPTGLHVHRTRTGSHVESYTGAAG